MNSIKSYMENDHQRCDALFIQAEVSVARADWVQGALDLANFSEALEHHLRMEEDILFPAFEDAIASRSGPTAVMRAEHQQIKELTASMGQAMAQCDADQFSGDADTLTILLQQHNLKEEDILYLMMDRVLGGRRTELLDAIKTMTVAPASAPVRPLNDDASHVSR